MKKKLALLSALAAVSVNTAFATTTDIPTSISSAFSGAQSNLSLAAIGVIATVAIVTGISFIVSLLRK
ncbi:hypothetical protein [Methylomonas sp. AM2-LC]|uniref:hypothetical protein n=1 Tax=Methylomonas sp. AM2-LC TaxID=3153301 RepID=UPI003267146D